MIRYAIVGGARTRREAEAYLPDNYRIIHETTEHELARPDRPVFVIEGQDEAGWTLDDYVIPRYGSGSIGCKEIDLSDPIMKEVPMKAADETAPCEVCGDAVLEGLRYMAGPLAGRMFCEDHDPLRGGPRAGFPEVMGDRATRPCAGCGMERIPLAGDSILCDRCQREREPGYPANADRPHRFDVGDRVRVDGSTDEMEVDDLTWLETSGKSYPTYTLTGWPMGISETVEDVLDTDDLVAVGESADATPRSAPEEFGGITTAPDDPAHVEQVINHLAHLEDEQVAKIRDELNKWAVASGFPDFRIVTWDHREQPDMVELSRVAAEGFVHFAFVPDTGSDQYVIVATKVELDSAEAQQAWTIYEKEEVPG